MATWATTADVQNITGETVTEAQLLQAEAVVEIYANRSTVLDTDSLSARDLDTLKKATCWQAAWQPQQPGYTGRQDVQEMQQDGARLTLGSAPRGGAGHTVTLAPLAARALRNLSWKGDRSLRRRSVRYPTGTSEWVDDPVLDQLYPWRPFTGGG